MTLPPDGPRRCRAVARTFAAAVLCIGIGMGYSGVAVAASCVPAMAPASASSTSAAATAVAAPPAPMPMAVGGNAQNPTDITSQVMANQYIQLQGGHYVVKVPAAVPNGMTVAQLIATLQAKKDSNARISLAWIMPATPLIDYTAVMSGSGTVTVTNQISATARADLQVSGGVLALHCMQTLHNADNSPVFAIEPNTAIEFVESYAWQQDPKTLQYGYSEGDAFDYHFASIANDGVFHSHVGYVWGDITGVGSAAFGHDYAWREDSLTDQHHYSGQVFMGYGAHVNNGATLDPRLQLWQQGIVSFNTHRGSLIKGQPKPQLNTYAGTYWSAGPDTQIQNGGVEQFTGEAFLITGVSTPTMMSPDDARKLGCLYGPGFAIQKGRTFYNMGTMLFGDGSPIVHYADGTTNFFLQGHPYNQNAWVTFGAFATQPTSMASVATQQALAFNYSGTYGVNLSINLEVDGVNVIGQHDKAWGNLIVMNPDPAGTGKAPNHAVLTQPAMIQGITQIEPNAILQLGDGTTGNEFIKQVTVTTAKGPTTYKNTCNMSGGNGMLITKANRPSIARLAPSDYFQIANDGKLIVNNTPGALSVTRTGLPELTAWMSGNTLDGIVGSGSVEQMGTLPLTLGAATGNANTYTGGTIVRSGATLIAGSATAFGARNAAVANSGKVQNAGVLRAGNGVRTINVPGDYSQAQISQ